MLSDIANAVMLGLVVAIVGLGILVIGSIYASFMGWILERLGW
jgi:hypothetical protein